MPSILLVTLASLAAVHTMAVPTGQGDKYITPDLRAACSSEDPLAYVHALEGGDSVLLSSEIMAEYCRYVQTIEGHALNVKRYCPYQPICFEISNPWVPGNFCIDTCSQCSNDYAPCGACEDANDPSRNTGDSLAGAIQCAAW